MFGAAVVLTVRSVQGHDALAVLVVEDHCVTAVGVEVGGQVAAVEQFFALRPVAVDFAVGVSDADAVAFFATIGPDHADFAVGLRKDVRSVGDAVSSPFGVASEEELNGFAYEVSKVLAEFSRAHTAVMVGHGSPFVNENHPGLTLLVDVQRSVDCVPVLGSDAAVGDVGERSEWIVGAVDRDSAVVVFAGEYRRENVEMTFIVVTFGRPEKVFYAVKIFGNGENGLRFAPVFEVVAHRATDTVAAHAAVEVVFSAVEKDIGVAAAVENRSFLRVDLGGVTFRIVFRFDRNVHVGYFHHSP